MRGAREHGVLHARAMLGVVGISGVYPGKAFRVCRIEATEGSTSHTVGERYLSRPSREWLARSREAKLSCLGINHHTAWGAVEVSPRGLAEMPSEDCPMLVGRRVNMGMVGIFPSDVLDGNSREQHGKSSELSRWYAGRRISVVEPSTEGLDGSRILVMEGTIP